MSFKNYPRRFFLLGFGLVIFMTSLYTPDDVRDIVKMKIRVIAHVIVADSPPLPGVKPAITLAAAEDAGTTEQKTIPLTDEVVTCFALNIYHEARGEELPDEARIGIGGIVLNRVEHPGYPDDPISVITQPGQFIWYDDNCWDLPVEEASSLVKAAELSRQIIEEYNRGDFVDLTNGALYFNSAEDISENEVFSKLDCQWWEDWKHWICHDLVDKILATN